jgi:hypothetical protein
MKKLLLVITLGTLAIAIPGLVKSKGRSPVPAPICNLLQEWSVTVDGRPATLATMKCKLGSRTWNQRLVLARWK